MRALASAVGLAAISCLIALSGCGHANSSASGECEQIERDFVDVVSLTRDATTANDDAARVVGQSTDADEYFEDLFNVLLHAARENRDAAWALQSVEPRTGPGEEMRRVLAWGFHRLSELNHGYVGNHNSYRDWRAATSRDALGAKLKTWFDGVLDGRRETDEMMAAIRYPGGCDIDRIVAIATQER